MGMKKSTTTTTETATAPVAAPTPQSSVESGTAAAINRLQKKTEPVAGTPDKKYVGRDFDKEARGKTRCALFEAALMSPAIAGMKFDTMDQYIALVRQAAEAGVAYTFPEDK